MKPIISLQCMRAVAAILVVVFHHMNTLRDGPAPNLPRFDIGEFGVDIFFVISGFIMWTTTAAPGGKPGAKPTTGTEFMRRRVIRIVPLYWALTFVVAFVSTRGGISVNFADVDYVRLLKSLLFIPQYHQVFTNMVAPYLVVGWTLESEMSFYVIFAFALALAPPKRIGVILAALALLTAIGVVFDPQNAILKGYTRDIIMEFGAGILLGRAYELKKAPRSLPVGLALVLAGVILVAFHASMPQWRSIYFGVPAVLIMTGTLALEDYCQSGAFRFPRFLGDASYSIYLSHLMAMAVSSRLVPRSFQAAHVIPTLLFEVAFAVAAGCAVYVVVEKRLTEMTRKLTTGWARPAKVAQGH